MRDANNADLASASTPKLLMWGVGSALAGSALSFAMSGSIIWGLAMGVGLYGATYLWPLAKRFVRGLMGIDDSPRHTEQSRHPKGAPGGQGGQFRSQPGGGIPDRGDI